MLHTFYGVPDPDEVGLQTPSYSESFICPAENECHKMSFVVKMAPVNAENLRVIGLIQSSAPKAMQEKESSMS